MGREERRRAEREQRRRDRRAAAVTSQATGRPPDPESAEELDRPKVKRPATGGGGAGAKKGTAAGKQSWAAPEQVPTEVSDAITTAASLRATSFGCGPLDGAEPQALGMTYSFLAAPDGEPYPMTIQFTGRRTVGRGKPGPPDSFTAEETIQRVMPGSGRVTITKRVEGVAPGDWTVAASPVSAGPRTRGPAAPAMPSRASTSGATGFAPIIRIRAPGVRITAWPSMVGLGAAVALTVQALLATRLSLPVVPVVLLSMVACLIGLAGARLYYLAEHPNQPKGLMNMTSGMCIQGFVLAAAGTVVVGALLLGMSVGTLLDATAPGLLFGMAIGRVGCFFGGCCAGRPTASRWGLWSSDRRLGTRRVPTQLLESTMALLIGLAVLLVGWTTTGRPAGAVFVAAIAAYTLGRQLLFPLRDLPRKTARGRVVTMVLAGLVLVSAIAVLALG